MGAGDLNSGPHASMAGTLPTEPSSQLQQFDFNRFKRANVLYSNNDTKEIVPGPLLVISYAQSNSRSTSLRKSHLCAEISTADFASNFLAGTQRNPK